MARILVTGVGGAAGASLARQLMAKGHWVLGVDRQRTRPGVADIVAVVSPCRAPEYLWELRGLVAKYDIQFLIPTVSEELVLAAEARDDFAPGVDVVIAQPAPVRTANDKYLTMTCLQSAGVSVPAFGLPSVLGSVHEAMDTLGGALVVKPRISRDGRGIRLLERTSDGGARAARIWATLDDSWIVQRFASGTEYASAILRGGSTPEPGDLVVVLEKTLPPMPRSGRSYSIRKLDGIAEPDVGRLATAAASSLGLTGPVGVDIRRMQNGIPVVLEVEARFGAYSAHAPQLVDNVLGRYLHGQLLGRSA
ncbi:ATP-grasp domain-containing protein [Paenarthrobacter sp. FR1]|uniref:ATP-grasp domain-containing protein n=1 Tax=Paenarthrobacter sp. FR1 TaxID=3439548 RepID=UPI003DA45AE9